MADTSPERAEGETASRTPPPPASPLRYIPIVVFGVVLLGSLIYLLVIAWGGSDLIHVTVVNSARATVHHPRPWLIAALIGGLLSLIGWAQTERERSALARDAGAAKAARDREKETREQLAESEQRQEASEAERERVTQQAEEAREDYEKKLRAERERRTREAARREQLERGWRAEREWNRELREQIRRLQHTQGMLGRHDDIREMVLDLTMRLVEAEKGILLSSPDDTGRGLEVVAHNGFESDPSDSALVHRFASEVIERDVTVREDRPARADKTTDADEEVDNLLAIPIYLTDEFAGVIVCANRDGGFSELEDEVLIAIGDHAGAVLQNSRLRGDLRNAYLSTIGVLADAIELKDRGLRGHSDSVSRYVVAVADQMELEAGRRESLVFASLLHDVGKLGISERILLKPGRLTSEERAVVQLHPRIGYELIRQVPALREIAPAILHHHERYDGDGYPSGLKGEAIPLEARVIAIADTFSAITSDRPYDGSRSAEAACAELERCAGAQFDPQLVRLFVEQVRRTAAHEAATEQVTFDDEIELQRAGGEFKLGGQSFAITDSLTLLYSHRHLHETAQAEAQRAALQDRPFAVVIATLLDLGEVNHTRGFAAGDQLLKQAADVVQQLAAESDALAFRASGRRIGLLIPDADVTRAEAAVESLLTSWKATDHDGELGIGCAVWIDGEDGEQVISRAIEAAEDRAGAEPFADAD